MISTELLLYVVTIAFVIFIAMYYIREDSGKKDPIYRFVPPPPSHDNSGAHEQYGQNQKLNYHETHCKQIGRCVCGGNNTPQNIHVNVNNDDQSFGGYPVPGGLPVGGYPSPPIDPLRKFDYDAMYDEFTPPFRRSYYDLYNYAMSPGLYPTYTRGPPGRFRKIGMLIGQDVSHDDKYKFLLLIGREKYPGRDYEYYVTMTNNHDKMKIYIDTKGKEITDGDIVIIPEMQGYKYMFKEDKDLSPRYDPYFV